MSDLKNVRNGHDQVEDKALVTDVKQTRLKKKRVRFDIEPETEQGEREKASPNLPVLYSAKKPKKGISSERIRAVVFSRLAKNEVQQLQRDLELYDVTDELLEYKFRHEAHDFIRWSILSSSVGPLFFMYWKCNHNLFSSMLQENESILELLFGTQHEAEERGHYQLVQQLFKDKLKFLIKIAPKYIQKFIQVRISNADFTDKLMYDINSIFVEEGLSKIEPRKLQLV